MIIRNKNNIFTLLFAWRGTILPQVLPEILGLSALSVVLAMVVHYRWLDVPAPPLVGFTIFGVVLSLFLGFRNNACYDRWWEGRKLWGALIATERHLARDTAILPPEQREIVLERVIVFVHLLRDRLRVQAAAPELFARYGQFDDNDMIQFKQQINLPQYCLQQIQNNLIAAHQQKHISDIIYTQLTAHITSLGSIQAGCDRIASTPLPFVYSALLRRAVYSFCVMLPFAIHSELGFWTPLMVAWLVYMFLGLDALSLQLEEPFGTQDNDLPLDSMVILMERELLMSLGRDVPPALAAQDFYLS